MGTEDGGAIPALIVEELQRYCRRQVLARLMARFGRRQVLALLLAEPSGP